MQWITYGLSLYKASPLLTESVFRDASHIGFPTTLADGILEDTTKRWIPDQFKNGFVRYGDGYFPIVSNTIPQLALTGDPSLVTVFEDQPIGYQIIPPATVDLATLLQRSEAFTVTTAFQQVPTTFPAFVIRCQNDRQGDTYWNEAFEPPYVLADGREITTNFSQMVGTYLISICDTNRLATLWLYAWLLNWALADHVRLGTWGFSDLALSGTDLDPMPMYLPEQTYARHVLLTAQRPERAINVQQLEYIIDLDVHAILHYALLRGTQPLP